jgi:UDP-N-acetylglucosamine 2-epimerase (non-hydrolysing)
VKILIVFGTRPEAIKMAPVVKALKKKLDVSVCVTAQHREMLDQVLNLFQITPDYDLDIMKEGQDLYDLTSNVLQGMKKVLRKSRPNMVLVHGDTTTSAATALAAFYLKIPVGHVEAGLRTYDIYSPFPEEFNRQLTSRIAKYHFAPTEKAKEKLLLEGIKESQMIVTGNTVIDALFSIIGEARASTFPENLLMQLPFLAKNKIPRIILITGHRRENFGSGFEEICEALRELAKHFPEVQFIYPVHLNPNVLKPVKRTLSNLSNMHLILPLDYLFFVKLMDISTLILTDSGGVQEEAPSLGKPVLVMRETSERPEAIEAGTVKLVGTNRNLIFKEVSSLLVDKKEYEKMAYSHNPYGDGHACQRILKLLQEVKS